MENDLKTIQPALSIITRTCQRPNELQRCINSVLNQTDPDFEHLIIPDEIGHGLYWANRQIAECASKIKGDYVYILDDDDLIVSYFFIEDLKKLINNLDSKPDVIVCRGVLNNEKLPKIWKAPIERGKIAAPNLITRNRIFEQHAFMWDQPRAGDFHFAESVWKANPNIFWWDYDVFRAESSCGFNEKQKQKFGFYG
jgi:GT2 family glycosyltransferase